jgi:hypothetical protein
MDDQVIMYVTRMIQLIIFIPIILAFRQLYRDVYDNPGNSDKN